VDRASTLCTLWLGQSVCHIGSLVTIIVPHGPRSQRYSSMYTVQYISYTPDTQRRSAILCALGCCTVHFICTTTVHFISTLSHRCVFYVAASEHRILYVHHIVALYTPCHLLYIAALYIGVNHTRSTLHLKCVHDIAAVYILSAPHSNTVYFLCDTTQHYTVHVLGYIAAL
jgi:hypothetical protein